MESKKGIASSSKQFVAENSIDWMAIYLDEVPHSSMQRADQRLSITIWVLGDEGVGKSSLISTFVSRCFSDIVPDVMTRVQLPPDPTMGTVTSIVDQPAFVIESNQQSTTMQFQSSENLAHGTNTNVETVAEQGPIRSVGLDNTLSNTSASSIAESVISKKIGDQAVDAIILVYDLDRPETFNRLMNHWLPLIEQWYGGNLPVIVAENKVDLARPTGNQFADNDPSQSFTSISDDYNLARKRQQVVAMMQRFPFIRQCIKCSAKDLTRVDEIFVKAQQAVLYPFTPALYNMDTGTLSTKCERALGRIFRIFDRDHDSLLSDSEIDQFQRETFQFAIFDRDLEECKNLIRRNHDVNFATASDGFGVVPNEVHIEQVNPEPLLREGKFTVAGFKSIFDLYISQNQLDVVWQALRKHGYDDDLNLYIPKSVIRPMDCVEIQTLASTGALPKIRRLQFVMMMQNWKLSSASKKFLSRLFRQFDSDNDGVLSSDDIVAIFSILPPPALPPWHPLRSAELCKFCFSHPKHSLIPCVSTEESQGGSLSDETANDTKVGSNSKVPLTDSMLIVPEACSSPTQSMISHGGLSILSASDSLPSLDVVGVDPFISKPLSYLEWMAHWHAIAAISPAISRIELYRLGHVEDYNRAFRKDYKRRRHHESRRHPPRKKFILSKPLAEQNSKLPKDPSKLDQDDFRLKSRELRILVLGNQSCGKTALLNFLCGAIIRKNSNKSSVASIKATDTTATVYPETSATFIKLKQKIDTCASYSCGQVEEKEIAVHLVFIEVPEMTANSQSQEIAVFLGSATSLDEAAYPGKQHSTSPNLFSQERKTSVFDLVMFVFDCSSSRSLDFVKDLETSLRSSEVPRVFVGTKADQVISSMNDVDEDETKLNVINAAIKYCRELDIEPPLLTSCADPINVPDPMILGACSCADDRQEVLEHISRCALLGEPGIETLKARPHEEQKRKDASRRRTMMWIGGIFTLVVVGVRLIWGSSSSTSKNKDSKVGSSTGGTSGIGLGWLRSWFDGNSPRAVKE